jgi:hypothetical protein
MIAWAAIVVIGLIAVTIAFPNGAGTCDLTPEAIKMNRPQRVRKKEKEAI